jgi:hypothetical protein
MEPIASAAGVKSSAVAAAIERLDQLKAEGNLSPDVIEAIRAQHGDRLKHIDGPSTGDGTIRSITTK